MNLTDFILTKEVDGKIVCNLFDYYERFIKPLDKRFENYSYYESKLVLCYLKGHSDINPSMGFIYDKKHKGTMLCHCFGCGATYNVVRLNQVINAQYHNKTMTEEESCRDLALKFGIDISDFKQSEEDFEARYASRFRRITALSKRYTVEDFKNNLLNIRKSGVSLNDVNRECIKMISTKKQLYD